MPHWTHPKCESSLVIYTLLSKVLEYLFKRCLANSVLCNTNFLSFSFDCTKEISDSFIFLWNSYLIEVTALLEQFDLFKLLCKELQELETVFLSIQELYECLKTHSTIRIDVLFHNKINPKSVPVDLVEDYSTESSVCALFYSLLKIDLLL